MYLYNYIIILNIILNMDKSGIKPDLIIFRKGAYKVPSITKIYGKNGA